MLGRVVTDFSRKILDRDFKISNSNGYFKEVNSLLDLIVLCEKNRNYVVFESKYGRREVAYVHDIRFDYAHGRIFFPVFTYKYKTVESEDLSTFKRSNLYKKTDTDEIMYSQSLEIFEIWNSKEGFLVDKLTILVKNFLFTKFYEFNLKDFPIRTDIKEESGHELLMKYVSSSVFNNEFSNFDYYSPKYSHLSSAEKNLLSKYGLVWYADDEYSNALNYRDVRSFTYADISSKFSDAELSMDKSFYLRVIDFESYLLCHLHEHVYWSDIDMTNMLEGRWFFTKYKERGIAIILKSDWLVYYQC